MEWGWALSPILVRQGRQGIKQRGESKIRGEFSQYGTGIEDAINKINTHFDMSKDTENTRNL